MLSTLFGKERNKNRDLIARFGEEFEERYYELSSYLFEKCIKEESMKYLIPSYEGITAMQIHKEIQDQLKFDKYNTNETIFEIDNLIEKYKTISEENFKELQDIFDIYLKYKDVKRVKKLMRDIKKGTFVKNVGKRKEKAEALAVANRLMQSK